MIQAIGLTSMPRRHQLKPAVDDLTFEARPGRVTVLLGPEGAGKTTALRLMLQLQAGRGTALFRGRPVHRITNLAREVGVLFGEVNGHPGRTARGHLRMLAAAAGVPASRADDVLDVVGLSGLADQRMSTFSRGMDRRLGVACALLGDPHTLVLDEPATDLSPRETVWLYSLLRGYARQGGAVLVTSHLSDEVAELADRVVSIDSGRLIADQGVADYVRTRLRPRVAVRTPHAERLVAVLTQEARRAGRSRSNGPLKVVREGGTKVAVYGSSCAEVGELAHRNGVLVHRLTDERGDSGDAYTPGPLTRADGRDQAGGTANIAFEVAVAGGGERTAQTEEDAVAVGALQPAAAARPSAGEGEELPAGPATATAARRLGGVAEEALQEELEEELEEEIEEALASEASVRAEAEAQSGEAAAEEPSDGPLPATARPERRPASSSNLHTASGTDSASSPDVKPGPGIDPDSVNGTSAADREDGLGAGPEPVLVTGSASSVSAAPSAVSEASSASGAAREEGAPQASGADSAGAEEAEADPEAVDSEAPTLRLSDGPLGLYPAAASTGNAAGSSEDGDLKQTADACADAPADPPVHPASSGAPEAAASASTTARGIVLKPLADPDAPAAQPSASASASPSPSASPSASTSPFVRTRASGDAPQPASPEAPQSPEPTSSPKPPQSPKSLRFPKTGRLKSGPVESASSSASTSEPPWVPDRPPVRAPAELPPQLHAVPRPGPAAPLRYELSRLTSIRSTWIAVALTPAVALCVCLVMAGTGAGLPSAPGDLLPPGVRLLAGWPAGGAFLLPPAAVAAGLLGAFAFGEEFRYPTLAPARSPVPRQLSLLAAKLAVSAVLALLLSALVATVNAVGVTLLFGTDSLELSTDTASAAGGSWQLHLTALSAYAVGCAWAGVLAAGMFRSGAVGTVVVVAVPLLLAPVAGAFFDGAPAPGRSIDGLPARLEAALLVPWPPGTERWFVYFLELASQPMGAALGLSLAVLLAGNLVAVLSSKVR